MRIMGHDTPNAMRRSAQRALGATIAIGFQRVP